jgi:hypothetical protein
VQVVVRKTEQAVLLAVAAARMKADGMQRVVALKKEEERLLEEVLEAGLLWGSAVILPMSRQSSIAMAAEPQPAAAAEVSERWLESPWMAGSKLVIVFANLAQLREKTVAQSVESTTVPFSAVPVLVLENPKRLIETVARKFHR